MDNYKCEICNRSFKQKIHYINHKNKKNKCSPDDIIIQPPRLHSSSLENKIAKSHVNL